MMIRFSWGEEMADRIRMWAALVCVGFLAACAGPVPKIDAKGGSLAKIRTIDVIRPRELHGYQVMYFGNPGVVFGLVGGLAAAADQVSKTERLSKELNKQGVSITSELADDVSADLNKMGYVAKVENGPWERHQDGKYELAFDKIKSDADAVLVLTPTIVGFVAPSSLSDYLPTITTVATLVGKDRTEQLYRGYHASGWEPKAGGWKDTPAKKTFPNFDALMANPRACVASLNDAAAAIADSVTSDLKRQSSAVAESAVATPQ